MKNWSFWRFYLTKTREGKTRDDSQESFSINSVFKLFSVHTVIKKKKKKPALSNSSGLKAPCW